MGKRSDSGQGESSFFRSLRAMGVALFMALFFAGCSGCDDANLCDDVVCENGQICFEGYCIDPGAACDPPCGAGEVCENGACVSSPTQCAAPGEVCDPRRVAGPGFLCIDWGGADEDGPRCTTSCAQTGCAGGSNCFLLTWGVPVSCASDAQCRPGEVCSGGGCYTAACRASECAGTGLGDAECDAYYGGQTGYESGAKCHDVGNGASYCFAAGEQAENEPCTEFFDAYGAGDLSRTCRSGLMCVEGQCRRGCTDGQACESDETCIGQSPARMGFCGPACEPFVLGSCGEGMTCHPVSGEEGYCRPAGTEEAFASCVPGAGQCGDGLTCVTFEGQGQGDVEARCMAMCNVAAAPTGADGRISPAAQALRDQSCPQPAPLPVYANFVHLAEAVGAVDFYIDGEPVGEGSTAFEAVLSPGTVGVDHRFGELAPGTRRLAVRMAGAPVTDAPLAETVVVTNSGALYLWGLVPVSSGTFDAVDLIVVAVGEVESPNEAGMSVVHAIPDMGVVDVYAIEASAPFDIDGATLLARDLVHGEGGDFVHLGLPAVDLYVFDSSSAERTEDTALLIYGAVEPLVEHGFFFLRGTLDPDDLNGTRAPTVLPSGLPRDLADRSLRLTCVDSGGGVYGYCQQVCEGPVSYGVQTCRGERMGCAPNWRPGHGEWQHGCVPVGSGEGGDACNPRVSFGECAEGYYCLEYGNTAPHYQVTGQRGLCRPLCADGDETSPTLQCDDGQICGPWSYTESFDVGRCGFPCDPGPSYGDAAACPTGLESCLPASTLEDDPQAPGLAPPVVVVEEPVCSASGSIAAGQGCAGLDCVAGTECLYPRSRQTDFTSTLLSPYFGAAGLSPTCTPQCDPFGTGRASHRCGQGETCLFNYPLSADVGHCAPIVEEREILGPCGRPGEACGEDAICVNNGGEHTCIRFCQYEGAGTQGGFTRSSCPTGFQCAPFVQDIGYCTVE